MNIYKLEKRNKNINFKLKFIALSIKEFSILSSIIDKKLKVIRK